MVFNEQLLNELVLFVEKGLDFGISVGLPLSSQFPSDVNSFEDVGGSIGFG